MMHCYSSVQKSRCGKVSCLDKNGERPIMILPAAATAGPSTRHSLKLKMLEKSSDSESDLSEF